MCEIDRNCHHSYRMVAELTIERQVILWGRRLVVPMSLRPQVLQLLHEGHSGVSRMKEIARSHVWWPNLDKDLGDLAAGCSSCRSTRNGPARSTDAKWPLPNQAWHRVYVEDVADHRGRRFEIA